MSPLTFTILITYIPAGIVVTGIYRATPVWEPDIPNWGLVLLWPFLVIWFSWWFTFTALPGVVTRFCRWLVTDDRKPKELPPDEVQKVLLGELRPDIKEKDEP